MTTTQTPTAADFYTNPYPGRKGNEVIVETCGKCSGTGSVSWGIDVSARLHNIDTGKVRDVPKVCFDCGGTGLYSFKVSSARARVRRHARKRAEQEAKAIARVAEIRAAREMFVTEYPDVPELLNTIAGDFGLSLREKFEAHGKLTANQVEAVRRIAAEQAAQPEATPVIEGRVTVTGKVMTVKDYDTEWGITYKMLVLDDRGFKVWGTVPRAIDPEKGDRVTFTATVSASDDDEAFGFYKRPTKAEVL